MATDEFSEGRTWKKEFKYGTLREGEGAEFFEIFLNNLPEGYKEVRRFYENPHLMPRDSREIDHENIYSIILPTGKSGIAEFVLYQNSSDLSPRKLFGILSVHGITSEARNEIKKDLIPVLEKLAE